jgi:hypothetical protein
MCAVALFFIMVSPFFWNHVHLSPGPSPTPDSYLYNNVYPRMNYLRTCVTAGEFPSWNPRQLCGAQFAADPLNGILQPLNLPFLLMPTEKAMAVQSFLCLTLMGIFMAGFLRATGLGYIAATFGAVCYTFCGATASAVTRPELATALVWLPAAFYCLRKLATRLGERQRFMVLAPLPLFCLLASGASALAAAGTVFVFAYAILHVLFAESPPPGAHLPKRLGLLALVLLVSMAFALAQWLPTYTWLKTLNAPASALWNEHLYDNIPTGLREFAAQLLVTRPGSAPRFAYIGITALLTISASFFHRRAWRETLFFAGVLGTGMVGLYLRPTMSDPYPWAACIYLAIFSIASLSAIGLDRLMMPRKGQVPESVILPAIGVFIVGFAMFHIATAESRGRIVVSVAVILCILLFRWRTASMVGGLTLILILYADLHTASLSRHRHPIQDAPGCFTAKNDTLMRAIEQAVGGRLITIPLRDDVSLPENLGMIFPVDCAGGAGIPQTREFARWWNAAGLGGANAENGNDSIHPWLLNLMSVKAILAPEPVAFLTDKRQDISVPGRTLDVHVNRLWDGTYCYLNASAFPRAYWTPKWRRAAGSEASLEQVTDPAFDPANECIVDSSLSNAAHLPDPTPSTVANTAPLACAMSPLPRFGARVETNASTPGIAILCEAYSGGHALLDGVEVPLLRINSLFQGIYVPEGKHVAEFRPESGGDMAKLLPLWVIFIAAYGALIGSWVFGGPGIKRGKR